PQLVGGFKVPGLVQQRALLKSGQAFPAHRPIVNLAGGGRPGQGIWLRLVGPAFFQSGGLFVVNHKQARRCEAKSTLALTRPFVFIIHSQQLVTNSPSLLISSKTGQPRSKPFRPFSSPPFTLSH